MAGLDPNPGTTQSGARLLKMAEPRAPEPSDGLTIAGYEIFELLGSGGMGTVYKARQLSTDRNVALKVMRSNVTRSTHLRELFAQEVQLAARLVHPNVVRIYDSGIDCGLYYYAMELIEGETLDRYVLTTVDDRSNQLGPPPRLPRREILELMKRVCQGVHHAHLRGVIHRDLKPRNIMVTRDSEPHVLDFGLATVAIQERMDEAPNFSPPLDSPFSDKHIGIDEILDRSSRDFAGTPAFMSPEQTHGRPEVLDIRTDVYSLGVVLYLLLTGRMPHDITGGATTVMRKVAREPILAPRNAGCGIDRELEALLLKALAHDREDRYPSAGVMAEDLGHYLNGQPLLAIRHTPAYVMRKWVTRHRRSVMTAACVLLLMTGLGAYSYLSHNTLQRTMVDRADYDQTLNLQIGRLNRQVSSRQIDDRDRLNASAEDAIRLFHDRPAKLADELDRIGITLLDQGWSQDAERRIERAVDLQSQSSLADLLKSMRMINDLAEVKREVGRFAESAALSRHALDLSAKVPGSDDQALRAQIELAYALDDQGHVDAAADAAQTAVTMSHRRYPNQPNHPDVLRALNTLAFVLRDQGKLSEAREIGWGALSARMQSPSLGESDPDTIRSMDVYATILCLIPNADSNTQQQARMWIDKAVKLSAGTLGLEHTDRLSLQNDRGTILCRAGDFEQATQCLQEATDSSRRLLGVDDRSTVALMTNLANVLCAWADAPNTLPLQRDSCRREAQDLLTQVIQIRSQNTSADDPTMLVSSDGLAAIECQRGELAKAQACYETTLRAREKIMGADDPALAPSIRNLARVLQYQKNWADAEPLYRRVWNMMIASQGLHSPAAQGALDDLNLMRVNQQEPPETPSDNAAGR